MSYSPSVSRIAHKDLYKSPNSSSRNILQKFSNDGASSSADDGPLNWRNAYKKRCFDEFKKSRQRLITKFRNLQVENDPATKVIDFLEEELLKIFILEAKINPNLITLDEANDICNQVQKELLSSNSFKDINDNDIEEIMKHIENDNKSLEESFLSLCCPICQKSNLFEADSMIKCISNKCEFVIDIKKSGINLSQLSARLKSILSQHMCSEMPSFQFKSADNMTSNDLVMLNQFNVNRQVPSFLIVSCHSCDLLEII